MKVPQIIKIVTKGSTYGVSFGSVVLEEITQISAVAYNIFRGNPFSMYGETLFITYQMLVIHLLFVILDKENRMKALALFPLIVGFFISGYFPELGWFPNYIFEHMITFQMVICKFYSIQLQEQDFFKSSKSTKSSQLEASP